MLFNHWLVILSHDRTEFIHGVMELSCAPWFLIWHVSATVVFEERTFYLHIVWSLIIGLRRMLIVLGAGTDFKASLSYVDFRQNLGLLVAWTENDKSSLPLCRWNKFLLDVLAIVHFWRDRWTRNVSFKIVTGILDLVDVLVVLEEVLFLLLDVISHHVYLDMLSHVFSLKDLELGAIQVGSDLIVGDHFVQFELLVGGQGIMSCLSKSET